VEWAGKHFNQTRRAVPQFLAGRVLVHGIRFLKRELRAYLMVSNTSDRNEMQIILRPVNQDNWRSVANIKVSEAQRAFVAEPCYYLALCCYGNDWHPLAICLDEQVIGFMMWAIDPTDGSCWLGGIIVDQSMQNRGYGKRAIQAAIAMSQGKYGHNNFALSYHPANLIAKHLYKNLGFKEMNEWEGDEIVARLSLTE
jgi:diamine N-acetyltransferase